MFALRRARPSEAERRQISAMVQDRRWPARLMRQRPWRSARQIGEASPARQFSFPWVGLLRCST